MKFLCPNCKAKYQIADEKIGGRTLKMDCRRCSHSIVIRGDASVSEPPPAAAPAPAQRTSGSRSGALPGARRAPAPGGRSGSHVGPSPARSSQRSALGADFRRSIASPPTAPTPPRVSPLDQWHVAINDVPVGPMRREEISRKIAAGAITAASLAWREGLDDWRPVEELPELAPLLKQAAAAPPPRPPGKSLPKAPVKPSDRPRGTMSGRAASSSRIPAAASRPAGGRAPARTEPVRPAARSNVVPIGGRLGAAAAPDLSDAEDGFEMDGEPTTVGSAESYGLEVPAAAVVAPPPPAEPSLLPDPFPASPAQASSAGATAAPSAEPEEKKRRGIVIPVGGWIAIAGAGAFGVSLAVIVATRYLSPAPTAIATVAPTVETPAPAPAPPPEAEIDVPDEAPPEEVVEAAATDTEEPSAPTRPTGSHAPAHPRSTGTSAAAATGSAAATKAPSALDSRFAEIEGDTGGAAPLARREGPGGSGGGSSSRGSGELTGDQIRTVVTRERRGLQSCYELAIRGMRDVPTVRLDVDITIGASGVVTAVSARGASSGVPTLSGCIERNVRRWHFPSSGGATQTTFPVVFQGAG